MADQEFVDNLGLGMSTLFSSMGKTCGENFPQLIDALKPSNTAVNIQTKAALADGFKLWCTCAGADVKIDTLKKNIEQLYYDVVVELAIVDDYDDSSDDYKGSVYVAATVAEGITTCGQMDQTQQLSGFLAPTAYQAIGKILQKTEKFDAKAPMKFKDTADTYRTETVKALLRTVPYSGNIDLKDGFQVAIYPLMTKPFIPASLKTDTTSTINTILNVAKDSITPFGKELIEIARLTNNSNLLMSFVSSPELYAKSKDAVMANIDIFYQQTYMMYSSLFMNVSRDNGEVLVSQIPFFVTQLQTTPNVGTTTIMTLGNIAATNPNAIYPFVSQILQNGQNAIGGAFMLAKVFSNTAKATEPSDAADQMLIQLIGLLNNPVISKDSNAPPVILGEISNILSVISGPEVLQPYIDQLTKYKASAEIAFTAINDFAAGRSLQKLTNRVDEIDVRVNALNCQIAETCTNMADVIAYVDANMADMKDFLAEVVKKLPNPKRLEVVGTLRKTLILHFECCHTGYEYPITSHEWSKWLKMGFSLVKAGQAIIDLGVGNPLGILKKGVECVQEIYEAYKTNDDDEFNTYITNPFLTSTEQDQLLEKLRSQHFFDIFAYDAQAAGWYLLHPEKDGKAPEAEAGSVTKVWRKEGYSGVGEAVKAAVADFVDPDLMDAINPLAGMVDGGMIIDTIVDTTESVSAAVLSKKNKEEKEVELSGKKSPTKGNNNANATYSPMAGGSGGRAAAMKEQFGSATIASAEEKLQQATQTAVYQKKVDDLEGKLQDLEKKVNNLTTEVHDLKNKQGSGCCVIA